MHSSRITNYELRYITAAAHAHLLRSLGPQQVIETKQRCRTISFNSDYLGTQQLD